MQARIPGVRTAERFGEQIDVLLLADAARIENAQLAGEPFGVAQCRIEAVRVDAAIPA